MKFYLDKNYVFDVKANICWEKRKSEYVDTEHENENEVMETDEISHETANGIVKQSLEMLECSPLKLLWSDRTLSIGKRKIMELQLNLKTHHASIGASINWK